MDILVIFGFAKKEVVFLVDHSSGLRFDIYERVHLSEDVIGIDELEEIELFPKIQVYPGDEYAALRGHLLLSGVYRGEGETRELEHWIPVEITIPLSRVNKLEEITVEIENFDVDLLSARSLNITGVLSLQGIETASLQRKEEEWTDREYVAAHEPVPGTEEEQFIQTQQNTYSNPVREIYEENHYTVQEILPDADKNEVYEQREEQSGGTFSWLNSTPFLTPAFTADKEPEENERPIDSPTESSMESEDVSEQESLSWFDDYTQSGRDPQRPGESEELVFGTEAYEEVEAVDAVPGIQEVEAVGAFEEDADAFEEVMVKQEEAHPQVEEKKELKVAFGSKKHNDREQDEGFGISKLISNRPDKEPSEAYSEEAAAPVQEEVEEVRWKSLFLGNTEEQTPFRKVRLVIVQRQETLDEIAERYQLSTRELQLYNRLSEHDLAEGQVLYIP
jgi:stage VI sporulation protein D